MTEMKRNKAKKRPKLIRFPSFFYSIFAATTSRHKPARARRNRGVLLRRTRKSATADGCHADGKGAQLSRSKRRQVSARTAHASPRIVLFVINSTFNLPLSGASPHHKKVPSHARLRSNDLHPDFPVIVVVLNHKSSLHIFLAAVSAIRTANWIRPL